jgi:hypothetical protein
MLQNPVVDVAIGLVLMYLMFALLCTVVNEFIATKLKLRATSLASGLEKLLDNQTLREAFYQHGLILGAKSAGTTGSQSTLDAAGKGTAAVLSVVKTAFSAPASAPPLADPGPRKDHPSYLSSKSVALALIGSLDTRKDIPAFADVERAVTALPDSRIRDALLASLMEAKGDLSALRTSIATWFDDSMDRLSGAYKRQIKWISMLIGLMIAILFNANTFEVATTLWNDPGRRASVVQAATNLRQAESSSASLTGQSVNEEDVKKSIQKTENTLRSLPIGWHCDTASANWLWICATTSAPLITLPQVLGWLLTAAALTLGAPFWFDLLSKFINLRGAGAKPQRADEKTA